MRSIDIVFILGIIVTFCVINTYAALTRAANSEQTAGNVLSQSMPQIEKENDTVAVEDKKESSDRNDSNSNSNNKNDPGSTTNNVKQDPRASPDAYSLSVSYINRTDGQLAALIEIPLKNCNINTPAKTIEQKCKKEIPPQYKKIGQKYLYFSEEKANWFHASMECRLFNNGTLATINNEDEGKDLFLHLLINSNGMYPRWWIDGYIYNYEKKQMYWSHSLRPMNYTNWHSGEPNNLVSEQCVLLEYRTPIYAMNDVNCLFEENFICELDPKLYCM